MSDPLSVAASIAGLVSLVDMIFGRTFRYVQEVRHADRSINDLANLLQNLGGTLHMLQQRIHVLDQTYVQQNLQSLPPVLADCTKLLSEINSKLAKYQRSRTPGASARLTSTLRNLQWPFDVSSTNDLLDQLTRFQDVLNTTLTADTMFVVHQILDQAGQLTEDIKQLKRSLSIKLDVLLKSIDLNTAQREAVKYFQTSDPSDRHKVATKLWHPQTGEWFTNSSDFDLWLKGDIPRLWLAGIPGAGKTILASAIIEKAKREMLTTGEDHALAYFYCDYKDSKTHEIVNVLGSLAAQIAVHKMEAMEILLSYYQKFCQPGRPPAMEDQPEFFQIIQQMASHFDRVIIVVDGLDECGASVRSVTTEIDKLIGQSLNNMSIMLLSREEHEIKLVLSAEYVQISIAARSPDLEKYVAEEVDLRIRDGRLIIDNVDVKLKIIAKLVDKAKGMWRWVACQIDYLCELENDHQREAALNNLPPDLVSSYDRILDKLTKIRARSVRQLIQRALKWIVYAEGSLTIAALLEALAIDDGDTAVSRSKMIHDSTIFRHCSSLVRRSADGDCIELAHATVKEYLEGLPIDQPEGFSQFRIERADSWLYMATVCLTYVNFPEFGNLNDIESSAKRTNNHPFHEHAVCGLMMYTYDHLDNDKVRPLAQKLMKRERSVNFLTWAHDFVRVAFLAAVTTGVPELEDVNKDNMLKISRNFTPLHLAASLCSPSLTKWLLEEGADVNAMVLTGPPLLAALSFEPDKMHAETSAMDNGISSRANTRMLEVVQILLDHGADATLRSIPPDGGDPVSPLRSLFTYFNTSTGGMSLLSSLVKLLIDAGAKLDRCSGEIAKRKGYFDTSESITSLFSLENIDLDYRAAFLNHCKTAVEVPRTELDQHNRDLLHAELRLLVRVGYTSRVEELLAVAGIDIDAPDPTSGMTALHEAADAKNIEMAAILLKKHASLNALDSRNDTPLYRCIRLNATEMADFFLKHGAKIKTKNRDGITAWTIAALNGADCLKPMLAIHGHDEDYICQVLSSTHGPLFYAPEALGKQVVSILTTSSSRVNLQDKKGRNLSYYAARLNYDVLQTLIDMQLDPLQRDSKGKTPLHVIADADMSQSVPFKQADLLIQHGCNPDAVSNTNNTALHKLLSNVSYFSQPSDDSSDDGSLFDSSSDQSSAYIEKISTEDKLSFLDLFLTESAKTASNSDGATPLDLCVRNACELDDFVEIFDHIVSYGLKPSSTKNLLENFIDGIEELEDVSRTIWTLDKIFAEFPDSDQVVRSSHGTKAAVWAAQNSAGDLLLKLMDRGVDLACKVKVGPHTDNVLIGLVHARHRRDVVKRVFDSCSIHDLEQRHNKANFSLLHLVCVEGDSSEATIMNLLLERGVKIEVVSSAGRTPLMLAAINKQLGLLKLLIANGAQCGRCDLRGFTAFQLACHHGSTNIVKFMLSNGHVDSERQARVRARYKHGKRNFTYDDCTALHLGVLTHRTMEVLIKSDLNTDIDIRTATLETPLHISAATGSCSVMSLLLSHGADVNAQNQDGMTALHFATKHGRIDAIRTLLEANADTEITTGDGQTALHFAASYDKLSAARLLREHGSTTCRDRDGLTPELLAHMKGFSDIAAILRDVSSPPEVPANAAQSVAEHSDDHDYRIGRPLIDAIKSGDRKLATGLVAIDNHKDDPICAGCSPILVALQQQRYKIANLLLENGYSTRVVACEHGSGWGLMPIHLIKKKMPQRTLELLLALTDSNDTFTQSGVHPMHMAIIEKDNTKFETLLDRETQRPGKIQQTLESFVVSRPPGIKAQPNSVFDTHQGFNLLHTAVTQQNLDIVKTLLGHYADVNARVRGALDTPLHIATMSDSPAMIELLVEHGADIEARNESGFTPMCLATNHNKRVAISSLLKGGASLEIDDIQLSCYAMFWQSSVCAPSLPRSTSLAKAVTEGQIGDRTLWDAGGGHILFHWPTATLGDFEPSVDSLARHVHWRGAKRLGLVLKWLEKRGFLDAQLHQARPSPLCFAAQRGDVSVIDKLLRAGASIDHLGCDAGSALMVACMLNRFDVVKLLARRDANLSIVDAEGTTFHAVASARGYEHIQRWLLVDRWTEQKRLCAPKPYHPGDRHQKIKPWSGIKRVTAPLDLGYKQYRGETMLEWHVRKSKMLKWFEGRVLYYGPGVKYVFAN